MLTVKNTFKLYDIVNKYYQNDYDSRTFISEIEEIMDDKIDLKMNDFATRKDFTELRSEFTELRSDFSRLESGVNLSLANSALMLEKMQKEQIKWLVGTMIAISGLTVAVIKLF